MIKKTCVALACSTLLAGTALAADSIKVGMMTTLSGPGAGLGIDIRDGFNLALKHLDGKIGGLNTEVITADDAQNPETAKQITERFVKRDKVDIATGVVFSNLMLAVGPAFFASETFYISANAGPSQYAGAECNPFFFNVAWQNDNLHEAMGKHVQDKGYKKVALIAPNYPAGKDALTGFKRFYQGAVAEEVYTKLGQLDYAAEIAQIRASGADALYIFLPGGMGINFIKQYSQSGMLKRTPLFAPGFSGDEDVVKAVGPAMEGTFNTSHWYREMDNPVNQRFVADFQKDFGRLPTLYASQGYDAAMLMDAAVKAVGGKIEDKAAFGKALATVKAPSTRGEYRFGNNHYPIQAYYLREVVKNADGSVSNKFVGKVMDEHVDAYAKDCKM
ncbi:ABC transporter substrate-binding protein [Parazoarcus communis]|uniref:ABC transporter substrate-binding protein n=2 Tax=root TaxID=1 RepID=A0A323URJ4_9RHOO|nr:ABC transporter substrate-binding protein [Parazoarcus communis]NMG72400.1 ABC transporter substrate-binding protein [Parazoarcus communis SWub3 = DSM 12120]PZA14633.1 ABC transporter substrate-binding protein [Azoarcus communis] [Parazoarcus communis SWub3 = DSM 12120]